MKKTIIITTTAIVAALTVSCTKKHSAVTESNTMSLKEMYGDKFLIGGAVNMQQVFGEDSLGQDIAKKHFNTIVAENCMKSEKINPSEGEYFWDDADAFVKFGEDNGMNIVGHCLVWHSQLAPWFTVDDKGNLVDKETLKKRMKDHITTVMTRYKGRVDGWDVVNEAIEEDGSYRNSPFYQILGEEYIPLAFQYAAEADPDAELYINDYGMDKPGRRDTYVRIVNDLKQRGLRVDAIGMQAHIGMDYPELDEFSAAIDSFATTGCKVMITEWDMSALPTVTQSANVSESAEMDIDMNPYPNGLPAEVDSIWNDRMEQVMRILINHSDVISRVNAWGVSDGESWRNDWPINGRTDYPLLFDRNHQMKPFLNNALKEKQS